MRPEKHLIQVVSWRRLETAKEKEQQGKIGGKSAKRGVTELMKGVLQGVGGQLC